MKSWEYEAVTYEGGIFCVGCLPKGFDQNEVYPIFADSEWDYWPTCEKCGAVHKYMSLTPEGVDYEEEEDRLARLRDAKPYRVTISRLVDVSANSPSEAVALAEAHLVEGLEQACLGYTEYFDFKPVRRRTKK